MRAFLTKLRGYTALTVILASFSWAALSIYFREAEAVPDGVITLRLSHWQLEAGVRDAFNEMAKEYQRLHPHVRIHQEAIPEGTYGQWMTTQLIGGTAPDIMQMGAGLAAAIQISYMNRYFVPFTSEVNRANPYNRGTELEGVPWRNTFKDGMRAGYRGELQEYILTPLAMFGVRIFYNKDLYEQLTGRTEPPQDYREFIAVCEKIRAQIDPDGRPYIPVASSRFNMWHWHDFMFDPLTYQVKYLADFDRDGLVSNVEFFAALRSGLLDWNEPAVRLRFQMVDEVTDYFQTGFTGLTRDEAVFLFAQERAVFITTGTWDALSLKEQAQEAFEVGLMEFPRPTPDDPVYGEVVEGPFYEMPTTAFSFGITRSSSHPELALDFLLFLSSQPGNEMLTGIIGWLPSIEGADIPDVLAEFQPNLRGIYSNAGETVLNLGGESFIRYQQLYSLFQVGQIEYEDMIGQYHDFYMDRGMRDWYEVSKDWRRSMIGDERVVIGLRERAQEEEGLRAQSFRAKYLNLVRDRLLAPEAGFFYTQRFVEEPLPPDTVGPYAYTERARENILRRAAEQLAAENAAPTPEEDDAPQ